MRYIIQQKKLDGYKGKRYNKTINKLCFELEGFLSPEHYLENVPGVQSVCLGKEFTSSIVRILNPFSGYKYDKGKYDCEPSVFNDEMYEIFKLNIFNSNLSELKIISSRVLESRIFQNISNIKLGGAEMWFSKEFKKKVNDYNSKYQERVDGQLALANKESEIERFEQLALVNGWS